MESSRAPVRAGGAAARFIKKHMAYQDSRSAPKFGLWQYAGKYKNNEGAGA
jgi:hypothetical protein